MASTFSRSCRLRLLPVFNKDGEAKKSSVGTPYRDLLKDKDASHVDNVFNRLLSMKEQGYPILNSSDHLKEIAKYLKDPTNPEILEKVCKAGVKNFNIDPFGNVRLCSIMEIVGNLRNDLPARNLAVRKRGAPERNDPDMR